MARGNKGHPCLTDNMPAAPLHNRLHPGIPKPPSGHSPALPAPTVWSPLPLVNHDMSSLHYHGLRPMFYVIRPNERTSLVCLTNNFMILYKIHEILLFSDSISLTAALLHGLRLDCRNISTRPSSGEPVFHLRIEESEQEVCRPRFLHT